VNVNLRHSRIGRAWIAMRDDEPAAACAGVPIVRTKLLAYATGAAFGGVSGAFLASYLGVVYPSQFEFSFSIFILAMVVLGGTGSIVGAVVGAIILSVVNTYLLPRVLFDLPGKVGLAFDLSAISSGIYGAILVMVMLFRPQGLVPDRRILRGLARVARARQHPALLAREQLVEVGMRDLLEVEAGLGGDLGDVPEHVAELARQRLQALLGHDAAVVAQQLLDLLGHLAGLAGQAQRRIDDVVARARVGRGAPGAPLVVGEEHGPRR
jgi:hypothetical protein